MATLVHGDRVGKTAKLKGGAAAAVFDDNREKILLTRRQDNGRWCLPGGAIDAGESASEACIREVFEETGLEVEVTKLVGIYTSPDWIVTYKDGNRWQYLSFFFEAKVVGGTLGLSDETTEVGFFSQHEIDELDLMETHILRARDAFENRERAFIR